MEIVPTNNVIIRKNSMTPRCKICFESSNEEQGELVSPCACDGSIKYVHKSCLNNWRFNGINDESKLKCEICKKPYIIKKSFEDETFIFNIYNFKKLKIAILYIIYILSCLLFSFLIFLMDISTNYASYNIISFRRNLDLRFINLIKNLSEGTFIFYYFSFSSYVFSVLFHFLSIIVPLYVVKRREMYFKKMWYKNLLIFIINIHFQIFFPLWGVNANNDLKFLQIYLGFMLTLFLNFPMHLLYIYISDCTIKEINEILNEIDILNCNYNPIYSNNIDISENKVNEQNIVIRNTFFQPVDHIAVEIINSPRRRLTNRRSPSNRVLDRPHPPTYPPPPPPPPPTLPPGM